MEPAILAAIGLVAFGILYAGHRFYYDYQITEDALRVTWLGIPVRRVRLTQIDSISKRRKGYSENWANTWRPRHRILVIRKKSGIWKGVVITPEYRYEFRQQLQAAMDRASQRD